MTQSPPFGRAHPASVHRTYAEANTVSRRLERITELLGPGWQEPGQATCHGTGVRAGRGATAPATCPSVHARRKQHRRLVTQDGQIGRQAGSGAADHSVAVGRDDALGA